MSPCRRTSGFTLAEVMICVALLSMAVLGLVSAQIFALQAGQGNKKRHTASVMAWRLLSDVEEQARRDFSVSAARPRQRAAERLGPNEMFQDYEYEIREQNLAPDFRRVEVVLHFTDDKGARSEYSAWTYLYDL